MEWILIQATCLTAEIYSVFLLLDLCQKIRWAYWVRVAFYKKKLAERYNDLDILEKCPALFLGHWIYKGLFVCLIFVLLSFFPLCIMLFICLFSQETKSFFLYSLLIKIYILCIAGNKQKHQKPTKTFNYQVICFENFVLIAIVYFS